MSDIVWQAIIGGCVTVVLAWLQLRTQVIMKNTAKSAVATGKEAASKADDVKQDLKKTTGAIREQLTELGVVSRDTHTLVNNNMAIQLRLNASLSRRLADMTGKQEDKDAAEQADRLYREHEAKQTVVDTAKVEKG
jgi:hypothetical protein